MYRKLNPPSLLRRASISFFLGFAVFLLGVALEDSLGRFGVRGMSAVIDDLLIGIMAGCLVFLYELHQHRTILRQMRVIAEMNHHVRNALQPILYSPYISEQAEQIRIIQESTQRIQWALREVLPGEAEETPSHKGTSVAA
jgi:hypothetical protein